MSDALCSLCHCQLEDGTPTAACPACGAPYHEACRDENNGCGTYGCTLVPSAEKQAVDVMPPTFWGQENKMCPACNREIKAAALRCRHCGAGFESAAPLTAEEYAGRGDRKVQANSEMRHARSVFIWSFVPVAAPVMIFLAWSGFNAARRRRGALPMERLFYGLALGVCALWILVLGLALLAM